MHTCILVCVCCIIIGEIAAIKVMEIAVDKEEDIKAELNVFNNHAHHPNIVDFYGAFVKRNHLIDNHLWIAMEVSDGNSIIVHYILIPAAACISHNNS